MDGPDDGSAFAAVPGPEGAQRIWAWLSDEGTRRLFAGIGITTAWNVHSDTDGSFLLLPCMGPEPGFALIPAGDDVEVLVGDPEREIELGPFPSLEAALQGIARWLASDNGTRH